MEPIAVSPREGFRALGVGATKGYELLNAGDLEHFKVGRATRITTESIKAFVARRVAEQRQAA